MLQELLIEIGFDVNLKPLKKLNKQLDEFNDIMKKIDSDKIESIEKSFDDLTKSTKAITKNLKKMNNEFKKMSKHTKKIEKDAERIADSLGDAEDRAGDLNNSLKRSQRSMNQTADGAQDIGRSLGDAVQRASRLGSELQGLSLGGVQSDIARLERAFGGVVQAAQRAAQEAGTIGQSAASGRTGVGKLEGAFDGVSNAVDKINDKLSSTSGIIVGLAGAAAGIFSGQALIEKALENSSLETKIEMGVSTKLSDEQKKSMKQSIRNMMAYGMDESAAYEAARKQFTMNPVTKDVSNSKMLELASAVTKSYEDVDLSELVQEANELSSVLGTTDQQALAAFDHLFKVGFQTNQLDTLPEYLTQTMEAGFSEVESIALAAAATAQDSWNIDNLLDGVKEGRLTMMGYGAGLNKAQTAFVKSIGIQPKKFEAWGDAIATGGEAGSKAMIDAVKHLDGMADGADKREFSVMLFGTKAEDQNLQKMIDTYLTMGDHMTDLNTMHTGLNDSVAAMNADPAVRLAQAMNDIHEAMQPVYNDLVGIVEEFANWIKQNPDAIRDTIQSIRDFAEPIVGFIGDIVEKTADWAAANPDSFKKILEYGAMIVGATVALSAVASALVGALGIFGSFVATWHTVKALGGGILDGTRTLGRSAVDLGRNGPRGWVDNRTNRRANAPGNGQTIFGRIRDSITGRSPTPPPSPVQTQQGRGSMQSQWEAFGRSIEAEGMANPSYDDGSLDTAANKLITAANALQRAANMLSGGAAGGTGGNGNNRRGNRRGSNNPNSTRNNPAGSLNNTSRSANNNTSRGLKLPKIPKALLKGGGIVTALLGGGMIVNDLMKGDTDAAMSTGSAVVGGTAGAWGGAKVGALVGSLVGPIGTAVGGVAGAVVGGVLGSGLGMKAYESIKSFDWGGLKQKAIDAKDSLSDTWDRIRGKASTEVEGMRVDSTQSANHLHDGLTEVIDKTKDATAATFKDIRNVTAYEMSDASTSAVASSESLKSGALNEFGKTGTESASIFERMKTSLASTWESMKTLASSAWSSVSTTISSSISSAVSTAMTLLSGLGSAVTSVVTGATSGIKSMASGFYEKGKSVVVKATDYIMGRHATGLGRVPFDGYIAELHKNEAVLTANQANALRSMGMLRGDGAAPQLNLPGETMSASNYAPLEATPSSMTTTTTTNNSGSVKASVNINVSGAGSPKQVAVNIKDELESWFTSLGTVFPASLEG